LPESGTKGKAIFRQKDRKLSVGHPPLGSARFSSVRPRTDPLHISRCLKQSAAAVSLLAGLTQRQATVLWMI
jgi:hypothetical protein